MITKNPLDYKITEGFEISDFRLRQRFLDFSQDFQRFQPEAYEISRSEQPSGVTKAVDKRPRYLRCNFVLAKGTLGTDQCPLFGVERCPLLGGSKCVSSMVKSIGGK